MRTWTYLWVSQLGMLAGTIVYVYAGTQLGEFWQLAPACSSRSRCSASFRSPPRRALDAIKAQRVMRAGRDPRASTATSS